MEAQFEFAKREETSWETLSPLLGASVTFIILSTIFIVAHFYTVLYLRPKRLALLWDDWLLIPAYLYTIGTCIVGLVMHHWETRGNRPGNEPITEFWQLEPVLKCIFILLELLVPAYAFTRYSILALYLRVFTGKFIRNFSYAMIAFITLQWLSFSLAIVFQCNPVAFYWDKTIEGGTCVDMNRFNRSFTPVNVAADVVILIMPFPTIWQLNLSNSRKVGITFVFGIGTAALMASIVRLTVLETHTTTVIIPSLTTKIVTWLVVEPSMYFLTACLPTMHPLLRLMIPASIRRYTEDRLVNHRQAGHPKLGSVSRSNRQQSFTRLEESGDTLQLRPNIPTESKGPVATVRSDRRSPSVTDMASMGSNVPMRDLERVQNGQDVMVTTEFEVSVTQEERVADVLGF